MPITFYQEAIDASLKNKEALKKYLRNTINQYLTDTRVINITYIFCNDEYLLKLNKRYLQHETLTDIITFNLSETPKKLVGEVYISIERVKENAANFNVSYNVELHRVIFHGVLHLCGFNDKGPSEKRRMTLLENQCLDEYFHKSQIYNL